MYFVGIDMKKVWSKKKIIEELEKIVVFNKEFPSTTYLREQHKSLYHAICNGRYGGKINDFRGMLGYKQHHLHNYWTEDTIIVTLNKIIKHIGHFPNQDDFVRLKEQGLQHAISNINGLNYYKQKFGYNIVKNDIGYWSEEKCINELQSIIQKTKNFPTHDEIRNIKKGLSEYIVSNGGISKYRERCGFSLNSLCSYRSELSSYACRRGKKTENIVLDILTNYCLDVGVQIPTKNKKLSSGNVIEFICNTNKSIGIDVTNTEVKSNVYHKWTKKDYYKYLDELWVVVVSDSFIEEDYIKWNEESPDNVYIYSIDEFIEELQYDLDEQTKSRIDKYKQCTFHTRNRFK